MQRQIDNSVLEMALIGFNARRDEIVEKIADIERRLGKRSKGASAPKSVVAKTPTAEAKPKRTMSAAARKRIGAAQKKRWAAFHATRRADNPARVTRKTSKRTMSPAVKATLAANLAKARAAKANKRAQEMGA